MVVDTPEQLSSQHLVDQGAQAESRVEPVVLIADVPELPIDRGLFPSHHSTFSRVDRRFANTNIAPLCASTPVVCIPASTNRSDPRRMS